MQVIHNSQSFGQVASLSHNDYTSWIIDHIYVRALRSRYMQTLGTRLQVICYKYICPCKTSTFIILGSRTKFKKRLKVDQLYMLKNQIQSICVNLQNLHLYKQLKGNACMNAYMCLI